MAGPDGTRAAGDSPAAIAADAARLRELERRAFARPASPEQQADAAAAAAELAELRAHARAVAGGVGRATAGGHPAPGSGWGDGADSLRAGAADGPAHTGDADDLDDLDDPTLGERLTDLARRVAARARALPRRTVRLAGVAALGAGLLAASAAAVVTALTAPPPAYSVFATDPTPKGERLNLQNGDAVAWANELEARGTIVLDGPHLFGDRDDQLRVGVYREWLDDERTEVCASLVTGNVSSFWTACTSEAAFRSEGLSDRFEQEGVRIDYGWAPDGTVTLETAVFGAATIEEVRALGLPAVAALDAAESDEAVAREVLPWFPDVLAGPVELGREDRWRFFGAIISSDSAPWEATPRPQICLSARDDRTRADGNGIVVNCATVERFIDEGLSVQTEDGLVAQWDAENVFDAELP